MEKSMFQKWKAGEITAGQYRSLCVQKRGFKDKNEWRIQNAKAHGFKDYKDYLNKLAQAKGFVNYYFYAHRPKEVAPVEVKITKKRRSHEELLAFKIEQASQKAIRKEERRKNTEAKLAEKLRIRKIKSEEKARKRLSATEKAYDDRKTGIKKPRKKYGEMGNEEKDKTRTKIGETLMAKSNQNVKKIIIPNVDKYAAVVSSPCIGCSLDCNPVSCHSLDRFVMGPL